MTQYGLTDKHINLIKNIFKQFLEVEEVIIFGSRAMNTFVSTSDIDLALCGYNLNINIMAKINTALDKLPLPYTFDILDYKTIKNNALLQHIKNKGVSFYLRGKDTQTQGHKK